MESLPPATRENLEAALHASAEERALGWARHEAGHAVAGIAVGMQVAYLTIGGNDPHASFSTSWATPRAGIIMTLAGEIAAEPGLAPMPFAERLARLRVDFQSSGGCDRCTVARTLRANFAYLYHLRQLAVFWGHLHAATASLLAHADVREQLDRLTAALFERTLLREADILALTNATVLQAVADDLWSPSA